MLGVIRIEYTLSIWIDWVLWFHVGTMMICFIGTNIIFVFVWMNCKIRICNLTFTFVRDYIYKNYILRVWCGVDSLPHSLHTTVNVVLCSDDTVCDTQFVTSCGEIFHEWEMMMRNRMNKTFFTSIACIVFSNHGFVFQNQVLRSLMQNVSMHFFLINR